MDIARNVIGIIPAYKPDFKLEDTLRDVIAQDFLAHVVVIDDGSGEDYGELFDRIEKLDRVTVLHLGVNSGTGEAIKFGLQDCIYRFPDTAGFVTFDADGQHHPDDIRKVVEAFRENPDKLIIGVRDFHNPAPHIPLRSRIGNRITEIVFHIFTGIHLTDTQSGLRCYPTVIAEKYIQIARSRYDFHLEALLTAADMTDYLQVPIQTIYEDNNSRSHFNPLLDSIRIYTVFLRFIASSLVCSVVDYLLFAGMFLFTGHVLRSLVFSRCICIVLNFFLNKKKVFRDNGKVLKQICCFVLLAAVLLTCSYFGITMLKKRFGMNPMLSKIIVELILFFTSFMVQRLIVFSRKNATGRA